jgi:site-specific DNA recombinase
LVYSPDRLSRKYAYQVLLIEEFSRHGVEIVFIKSPQASTPEEHLLVQFQGMIAEYERAQIVERSRRGKRHRARSGIVNVLSGAPYGYRYMKKTEDSTAHYVIIETEASVVRKIYYWYTHELLSIGEIARRLTAEGVPTSKGKNFWDRSTIWGMLRNPVYKGTACFGKTETCERKKITRRLRKRGGFSPRCTANCERPREEWIEIPVPVIISEETFAIAQERLERNKQISRRRTKEPTLLQGLLVCETCGYALYRSSTRTTKRKLYYYRCIGSDNWRYPNGRVCINRPIRQDYLDELIWKQVVRLIENPDLVREEINRRIKEAQDSNPAKIRKEVLVKEGIRIQSGMDRLLDAYQEGLLPIQELRVRVRELRKRKAAMESELQSIEAKVINEKVYLQLVNKIDDFLDHIRKSAESMNVLERQRILRLIVKEVLVGPDTLKVVHSIPLVNSNSGELNGGGSSGYIEAPSYLLCRGSNYSPLRSSISLIFYFHIFHYPRFKKSLNQV